jgi:hypothetical protein
VGIRRAAAPVVLCLLLAPPASAGTYEVSSCSNADGARLGIDVLVPDARRHLPVGNVKADAKGRFRFTYRFRRTLVRARYRFQARLTAQPGYPYRGAVSKRVAVVVSP